MEDRIVEITDEEEEVIPKNQIQETNKGDDDDIIVPRNNGSNADDEEDVCDETEEEIEASRLKSLEHKEKGNDYFRDGEWFAALDEYAEGISACSKKLKSELSILYSNRAAAYLKLNNYEHVVIECNSALELNPNNFKALYRRAFANDKLENFTECLKDMQRMTEIDPNDKWVISNRSRVQQQEKEKQEKEKQEMFSKLKEVGNSLLGLVGLSVDNFQFAQDPKTGGYSVNFVNK